METEKQKLLIYKDCSTKKILFVKRSLFRQRKHIFERNYQKSQLQYFNLTLARKKFQFESLANRVNELNFEVIRSLLYLVTVLLAKCIKLSVGIIAEKKV